MGQPLSDAARLPTPEIAVRLRSSGATRRSLADPGKISVGGNQPFVAAFSKNRQPWGSRLDGLAALDRALDGQHIAYDHMVALAGGDHIVKLRNSSELRDSASYIVLGTIGRAVGPNELKLRRKHGPHLLRISRGYRFE